MTVERIKRLDIHNRPVFTGIYGHNFGQEYYVENNLCKYNFWQELYRYLRGEGYTTVFYNSEFNFFSYEESQLDTLFFRKPEEIAEHDRRYNNQASTSKFVAPIASPNGKNRRRGIRLNAVGGPQTDGQTSQEARTLQSAMSTPVARVESDTQLVSHNPGILVHQTETDQFFQLKSDERVLDIIFRFVDINKGHKLAVVFTVPEAISFGAAEIGWETNLQARYNQQLVAGSNLRLIVSYDFGDVKALNEAFEKRERGFFFRTWFYDQMFPYYKDGKKDLYAPSEALFCVEGWGRDEVGNVLKRRRIMDGLQHTLHPIPFGNLCVRIWQQFTVDDPVTGEDRDIDTVHELMALPTSVLEGLLLKMDNEKAMDRLKKLLGMEGIIAQFERYLADMRACRERGEKFRRHMVFMGNPGTGKTTVARIFADVLREEGLLENGRLHQVTVGDLVGEYIGSTRPKTQAVCQRARGGVLFIDEAYGLYQSGAADTGTAVGGNQYGQEAIEVLLQFMENDEKSLVIMAGYPKEMEDLLKNGNAGFNSRIGEQGRFNFEDYSPDVLLQIALSKLKGAEYTDKFRKDLHAILSAEYRFKDKDWANARTAENIISKIKSNYRALQLTGPYDSDAIPDDLMRLIRVLTPEEEAELLKELNSMTGLRKVKGELRKIFSVAKANRIRLEKIGNYQAMPDLTFVFEGNPGTGKTTVARLMGKILAGYGMIKNAEVKEYGKGNIVSTVRGGSVKLVNEMFDDCIGRVMFIDEAYALAEPDCKDAVDQIVQNMTLPKYQGKMAIIMAGYPGDMEKLMGVNAGMARRFRYKIHFEDYTNEELTEMYKNFIASKGLVLADGCESKILEWFKAQPRGGKFGNGGLLANIHKEVEARCGERLANNDSTPDTDFYRTILPDDIPGTSVERKSDQEILAELNNLIGLKKIKDKLQDIIATVTIQQLNAENGRIEEGKVGLNFVFKGNPGTGKTTVARLLGNILANYGLISSPEVVTYTKGQLVDGIVGGGSRNVEKMFEAAMGKVLFIDEAYQLAGQDSKDALDALTSMVTDKRYKDKLAIVLAGYPGEMAQLISSNPGLHSRFTQEIFFEDYTNEELTEIFRHKMKGYELNEDALAHATAYFSSLKRNKDFGNARETEKLRDEVKGRLGKRIISEFTSKGLKPPKEVLFTILPEYFPNYGKVNVAAYKSRQENEPSPMEKLDKLIGIDEIRDKFKRYVAMAHYCRENPQASISATFRPHMAFLGNPGTGKTTVARLFGEILREEHLLTNSNFVKVSPGDLIGEFLGRSAPKARAQFERARGGILFIDEAYELYKQSKTIHGGNSYGEEVITELIQFMEDDRDTVVILAGYTDEIRYLLRNGNAGLKSRVTYEFMFNDYEPQVLFDILMNKLREHELSNEFRTRMQQIINYEYNHRDPKVWGNARNMERYAQDIFQAFLIKHGAKGVLDIDCIPDYLAKDLSPDIQ